MSLSERCLWMVLRRNSLGFRVRRQFPIGPYVLDFYVPSTKVCIEVDGEQHRLTQERDAARDAYLLGLGVLTIRVSSLDLYNPEGDSFGEWVEHIEKVCRSRIAET